MSLTQSERRPALLLGCDVANCLAAIRALGRKQIPLAVSGAAGGLVSRSRWYREWPAQSEPQADVSGLTAHLAALGLPSGGVLIPCTDAWVETLGRVPDGAAPAGFCWSSPTGRAAEACLDKAKFAETLAALDLPRPRTWFPERGQMPAAHELAACFIKPRDSGAFDARFGVKGFRLGSAQEAGARLRECDQAGLAVILQELIPGPTAAHHFLDGFIDRFGRIRALFARRRLRAQHGTLSNSSCLVSIEPKVMAQAERDLRRLLAAIGYRGIFSVEFKLDYRDGLFKFIEVNTRPWADMGLALRCGVDVVEMAYLDAQGLETPEVTSYVAGQHWVSLFRDRTVAGALVRAGELTWTAVARQWLGASFDFLALDDPMPALGDFGRRLRSRLMRTAARA